MYWATISGPPWECSQVVAKSGLYAVRGYPSSHPPQVQPQTSPRASLAKHLVPDLGLSPYFCRVSTFEDCHMRTLGNTVLSTIEALNCEDVRLRHGVMTSCFRSTSMVKGVSKSLIKYIASIYFLSPRRAD